MSQPLGPRWLDPLRARVQMWSMPQLLQVRATTTDAKLREFLREHPAEPRGVARSGNRVTVELLVSAPRLKRLRQFADVEILFNATVEGRIQQLRFASGPAFVMNSRLSVAEQIMERSAYLGVDGVEAAIKSFANDYQQLAWVDALPNITACKRTCTYVRIGAAAAQPKDVLLITGGVHGREWGSCEIALTFASRLLEAYVHNTDLAFSLNSIQVSYTAQQIHDLLDTIDIVIFPQVNPDGRDFSQTALGGSEWQKNRNTQYEIAGDPLSIGVDINRNFDFLFKLDAFDPDAGVSATSKPEKHDFYQGPKPFSEAESCNVQWLLDRYSRTRWYVDLHSNGNRMLHAWSDDTMQSSDPEQNFTNSDFNGMRGAPDSSYAEYIDSNELQAVQALAQVFVGTVNSLGAHNYQVQPAYDFYAAPIAGASHDYAYSRHLTVEPPPKPKILGFVVEWGDTPHPDWPDMKTVIEEVSAGLVGFCIAAAAT